MSVINTNISALQAQTSLRSTNLNLATSMERLSSGTRINSAKDDAAGLAISTRMTANIRGISAAIRNANDGISLTQTAESSLSQIGDNLQRVRELAVQSANTGNSASDRAAMNNEAKQLIAEIDRVASNTAFNGIKLLDGTFRNQDLQVGASNDVNDRISLSVGSAKSSALGVGSGSSYAASTVGVAVGSTALAAGELNINGFTTGAATDDGVSNTGASTSGIAVAAVINAISSNTNVTATVGETNVAGTAVTGYTTAIESGDITLNGVSLGAMAAASTAVGRGGQVTAAINNVSSQTGVTATLDSTTGAVTMNAADGRNITLTSSVEATVTGLASGGTTYSMAGATSTSTAAVSGLTVNGVSIDSVSADPTVVTTNSSEDITTSAVTTAGSAEVKQTTAITFTDLQGTETVTVGGLTFTAGANGASAADVTLAFSTVGAGMTAAQATLASADNVSTGSFGAVGTFAAGDMDTDGVFTATTAASTLIDLGIASTATAVPTEVATAYGDNTDTVVQTNTITFTSLAANESITVGGLTFTANAAATSDDVMLAFSTVTAEMTAADASTAAALVTTGDFGTGSEKFVDGAMDASGVFTATTDSDTQIDLDVSTTAVVGVNDETTTAGEANSDKQVTTITFQDLAAGESVSVGGLVFTATADTTAEEVTLAYSTVITGMTAAAASTAASSNVTTGSFGTSTSTVFAAGAMDTDGVFTATAASSTQIALGVTSDAAAGVPTVVNTTEGNADQINQVSTITFTSLASGESMTVGGLTFTASSETTAAQVKTAFSTVTTGMVASAATTAAVAVTTGDFGAGTETFAAGAMNSSGVFTATSASSTKIFLGVSTTAATAPTDTATTVGVSGTRQQISLTFKDLDAGSTVEIGGLTFTATDDTTAEDVKLAFSTVTAGMLTTEADALRLASGVTTGGFVTASETFAAGDMDADGVFTATAPSSTLIDLAISSDQDATPADVSTNGALAVQEEITVTFQDLVAGTTVAVGGLTFTSGTSGTTAAQLATAFATVNASDTYTQANSRASANVSDAIGYFTAGSFVSTGDMAASGVFTAATGSDTAIDLGISATENSVITFSSLSAGQSATVNGLTFTAADDMTSANVAAAFADLTDGMTADTATSSNTASAALGSYSGTFAAGFTTGSISGSTVTSSATTSGDVTDIQVTSEKFSNLAIAINAVSDETGVTAVNTAGSIALSSSSNNIVLTSNTASVTGISGDDVVSDNATSTSRSTVTLTSSSSAGISISGSTADALSAAGFSEGSATVTTTVGAGVSSIDLTTAAGSQAALTTLDSAINTITDSRASMGAYQNRLGASISNLESSSMNLSASRSRILDTDYAKETTSLAKAQIISQAATAMLAQANQSGQSVLALLK